jgi:DNA modification methylase
MEYRPISDIKVSESNPRKINKKKYYELLDDMKKDPEFFKGRPLLLSDRTGELVLIAGHQRYRAAKELGMEKVPTHLFKNLTEEKERNYMIKDNVHKGEFDFDMLANEWEPEELKEAGLEVWNTDDDPDFTEPDEKMDTMSEEDYEIESSDVKLGDLIEIGDHRLLCGDATLPLAVKRVLNGEKCEMVFTDPPYGVNVQGGKQKSNIAGDLTQTAIPFSFELAIEQATSETARLYFCGGEGNIGLYAKLFERFLSQIPRHLIWVKNGFSMKQNGYHNQYEIIFYGYKKGGGGMKTWYGPRTESAASDVWKVDRDPSNTYMHPTQKPIDLPARAIINHSQEGDHIYEPFGGSGSTLMACQKLGRKAIALEIDPHYCQVIINRFQNSYPDLPIKINGKDYKS